MLNRTPATAPHAILLRTLDQLENALNHAEQGDALAFTAKAKELALQIAQHAPCPDCGSTDEGHATPCSKRAAGTTIKQFALVLAVLFSGAALADGAHCNPKNDTPEAQVIDACGQPKARYAARWTNSEIIQAEWDYGATMVGFIDGRVAYVLDLREGE